MMYDVTRHSCVLFERRRRVEQRRADDFRRLEADAIFQDSNLVTEANRSGLMVVAVALNLVFTVRIEHFVKDVLEEAFIAVVGHSEAVQRLNRKRKRE